MTAIRNKRKIVLMLFIFAALAMTLLFTLGKTNQSFTSMNNIKLSYSDIAQAIKIKYDQELGKLEDYKASHYAARIYRISGITTYLAYNSQDLRNMKDD